MSIPLELVPVVETFLQKHNISVKSDMPEVVAILIMHTDALIYNVASIACVMAMLEGKKKVEPRHLGEVRKYIDEKCPHKQAGGNPTGFPVQYFSPLAFGNYTENANIGANRVETVKFDQGYARENMGPLTGGSHVTSVLKGDKVATNFMKKVMEHHNMKVSKMATPELLHIMDSHLECLAKDMHEQGDMTKSKLLRIMRLKRHAVFH